MNIAFKGHFLREGLLSNGHYIHDLTIKNDENLNDALQSAPVPIDLVIWELFGAFSNIQALAPCEQPVAVFCIDTPLNEFWLKPCAKNIDYIFVDQPQSVSSLADCGIAASWLPLPAQKSYFQPLRRKKFDITFIGRTNNLRIKRNNILKLVSSKFKINIMAGMDIPTTQNIFSESKIILNENFFPGLTLRVLQGLGSGSIVFTEQSPYSDNFGLVDNHDLVFYNSDNILERLSELLEHYENYGDIGLYGQAKCRELYSCERTASELISKIGIGSRSGRCANDPDYLWNQINSELLFVQRFGGNFSKPISQLERLAKSSPDRATDAHVLIGDLQARVKRDRSARMHYLAALDITPGSVANLKLALLDIERNELDSALKSIIAYLLLSPNKISQNTEQLLVSGKDMAQVLLSVVANIYFSLGKYWDMGFHKNFRDPVPDTAFEIARMSWEMHPSSEALNIMLKCLRPYHMQAELLPCMLDAIKMGLLSDSQILETAKMAFEYYDRDTASTIISAMKKAR